MFSIFHMLGHYVILNIVNLAQWSFGIYLKF